MNKILLSVIAGTALAAGAHDIEFDKIEHWTGSGSNRAALVVQFDLAESEDPGALVWGYRWDSDTEATSDEMMRRIAEASSDLVLLVQYTGWMGYTLDGIGYGPSTSALLGALWFDYDSAARDGRISFGYLTPNTGMGQTSAPGGDAEGLAMTAIDDAATSHVVEHPLNARIYGYPAYDYDHWKLDESRLPESSLGKAHWAAGWYDGYWSFWVGSEGSLDDLSYSGMGMSSVKIEDGQVSAWKYQKLDGPVTGGDADGVTGASTKWSAPNYLHFKSPSATLSVDADRLDGTVEIYRINGMRVTIDEMRMKPGFYIIRSNGESRKVFVNQ